MSKWSTISAQGRDGRRIADWPILPAAKASVCVAVISGMAITAMSASGLPAGLRVLGAFVVAAYTLYWIIRLLRPRWKALAVEENGPVVIDHADRRFNLSVHGRPFVSPVYIGFSGRIVQSGRRCSIGLFRGQLADDHFRRLAASLRVAHETVMQ